MKSRAPTPLLDKEKKKGKRRSRTGRRTGRLETGAGFSVARGSRGEEGFEKAGER